MATKTKYFMYCTYIFFFIHHSKSLFTCVIFDEKPIMTQNTFK